LKANGDASEIPRLIGELRQAHSSEQFMRLWEARWESSYHQYDIYSASYAVVPHIVDLMAQSPPEKRLPFASAIGMIAALAHCKDVDPVPEDIKPGYFASLEKVAEFILDCFKVNWTDEEYAILCGALAAVQGHPVLAIDLMEVIANPSEIFCSKCEEFFPSFGYELILGDE